MASVLSPYITVSELDHLRLTRLMAQLSPEFTATPACVRLAEMLEMADTLEPADMPSDVLTMHSRVAVRDAGGQRQELTLGYPDEADASRGWVSVFSPLGAQLLGTRVPGRIEWQEPGGADHALDLIELCYQPEASGDYAA